MKTKDIIACGASLYRVLNVTDGTMFVMDCLNPKMPFWISGVEADCKYVTEQELYERTGKANVSLDDLDAVIGLVSTVCLNHISLLIVDEIQNVVNSKNGKNLVGALTQLINSSGISICMVGTPECVPFFERAIQVVGS